MFLKNNEGFKTLEKIVVISDVLAGSGKIDIIQIRHIPWVKHYFTSKFTKTFFTLIFQ